MPNTTISQLPAASLPLTGTEQAAVDQAGATKRVSINQIGGLDIPQRLVTGTNDSFQIGDRGDHLYVENIATPCTIAIPNNATVPFPIGSVITVAVDPASGVVTFDASAITLLQAGTLNVGNRTLAAQGEDTFLKVKTDTWFVNGAGLT